MRWAEGCFLICIRKETVLLVVRITLSVLFSLVLHLVLLFMPVLGGRGISYLSQEGASSKIDALLKLDLVVSRVPGKLSSPLPVRQVLPIQNNAKTTTSGMGAGLFSAPKPDQTPILLSEIDVAVESFGVKGKMILHLEIDAAGQVEFSEIIYSELPDVVGWELQRRFSEARFQPAVSDGRPVGASLLLRVDVD